MFKCVLISSVINKNCDIGIFEVEFSNYITAPEQIVDKVAS